MKGDNPHALNEWSVVSIFFLDTLRFVGVSHNLTMVDDVFVRIQAIAIFIILLVKKNHSFIIYLGVSRTLSNADH